MQRMNTRNKEVVSDIAIARRLATQIWGRVKRQYKAADGAWWFDCERNRGYVVDTNIYREFRGEEHRVYKNLKIDGEIQTLVLSREQHFCVFEGDSKWVIVEWVYPFLMKKRYKKDCGMKYEAWQEEELKKMYKKVMEYDLERGRKYPTGGFRKYPKEKGNVENK